MSSVYDRPILEFDNVRFRYPGNGIVIDTVSFSVKNGEFIGLLGANGSGKSTMLKLAAGILKTEAGTVRLWEKPIDTYRNRDRAKLISYFPQTLDITIPFTVRQIASMGLYPYDIPPHITVEEALDAVGLTEKADTLIGHLSGGERRRAFIAMTLVQGAGILLLDEPLSNLDIRYQRDLLRLLKQLREKKDISVIMALHDINLALQFEKVMLIKDGQMVDIGEAARVLTGKALKDAFDVDLEIKHEGSGKAFISYGDLL